MLRSNEALFNGDVMKIIADSMASATLIQFKFKFCKG